MNQRELDRIVAESKLLPQASSEPSVQVVMDGKSIEVPATVGVYMAVSNMNAMMQQLMIRLDALHSHLADRDPKRSRKKCVICRAEDMTPEELEQMMAHQIEQNALLEEGEEQSENPQEEEEEQVQE